MIQKQGTTRRVFIYKNIVIKVARIFWLESIKVFILRNDLEAIKKYGFRKFLIRRKDLKLRRLNNKEKFEKHRLEKEEAIKMKVLPTKKYEIDLRVETCLFAGIMANLHEWKFYRKTKNPFTMPTYFSFFGLFNIQKRGETVNFCERDELRSYVCQNIEEEDQLFCDEHTLSSVDNYCLDNEHLKLVDYGNRQVAEFLIINGENLYNNFKHPD